MMKIDNLILRRPIEKDILCRYTYGRPLEFRRMCGGSITNIPLFTIDDAKEWFNSETANPYSFVIELDGKMIGVARLVLSAKMEARYSIGIFDDMYYNKGIGAKVTIRMLEFAFSELKLKYIDLVVLEFNNRAIACYKKCGFKFIRRIKKSIEIDGVYYDNIIMAISNEE